MLIERTAFFRWVSSQEASKELGFSEKTLKCWVNCGYLKDGKHWRYQSPKSSSKILYNIQLCQMEMNEWWGRNAFVGP